MNVIINGRAYLQLIKSSTLHTIQLYKSTNTTLPLYKLYYHYYSTNNTTPTPHYKKGNKVFMRNSTPITITNVISKFTEYILSND